MSGHAPHVLDTSSGRRLDLDDPQRDQIAVEDIVAAPWSAGVCVRAARRVGRSCSRHTGR